MKFNLKNSSVKVLRALRDFFVNVLIAILMIQLLVWYVLRTPFALFAKFFPETSQFLDKSITGLLGTIFYGVFMIPMLFIFPFTQLSSNHGDWVAMEKWFHRKTSVLAHAILHPFATLAKFVHSIIIPGAYLEEWHINKPYIKKPKKVDSPARLCFYWGGNTATQYGVRGQFAQILADEENNKSYYFSHYRSVNKDFLIERYMQDMRQAISQDSNCENIFFHGYSMGAAIALEVVARLGQEGLLENKQLTLVVDRGFTSLTDVVRQFPALMMSLPYLKFAWDLDNVKSIDNIKNQGESGAWKALNTLVVTGEDDEILKSAKLERQHFQNLGDVNYSFKMAGHYSYTGSKGLRCAVNRVVRPEQSLGHNKDCEQDRKMGR